jgi:hypothetical protein
VSRGGVMEEDLLASSAMGFMLGVLAFIGGTVRLRYWASRMRQTAPTPAAHAPDPRYAAPQTARTSSGWFRAALSHILVLDRVGDLIMALLFVSVLLYGAWIVPRLRVVVGVAVATAIVLALLWRKVARWLKES